MNQLPRILQAHRFKLLRVLLGAGTLVALWLALHPRAREPIYQGKTLSYWMDHLSGTEFSRSFDAVRAIGAEGVPWLLSKVRSAHTVHYGWFCVAWPKIPLGLRKHLPVPIPAKEIDEKVAHALSLLDFKGVPGLLAAFENPNPNVRRVAALAVGRMLLTEQVVDASVPGLSRLLADSDDSVRMAALNALEKMETGAKGAVPALIRVIREPEPHRSGVLGIGFKALAVRLLGQIGPAARAAAPDLSKLLGAPEQDVRSQAAVALWRINHDTNMVPVLTAELDRAGLLTSPDVLFCLGEMGPAAKEAVPVFLRKLEDPQFSSFSLVGSDFVLKTLDKIDRKAAEKVRQKHDAELQSEQVKRWFGGHAAEIAAATERQRRQAESALISTNSQPAPMQDSTTPKSQPSP